MKIESVRIENFRSFKDETIKFDNYTCFVGPNGSGKSTVLNALNIFFRQYKDCQTDFSNLTKEDFHHKNTKDPIKITVTFTELPKKAKEDLSDYVRQDKLIVSSVAKYDSRIDSAEVRQYGSRLGFEDFRKYFEADKNGEKPDVLKNIYLELQKKYTELPKPGSKSVMVKSLKDYEASHPDDCKLIPSPDQFYGVSKGANRLAPHIQWVFVAASKDVTEESEESKTSALGQLLARTVRSKVNFSEKIDGLKNKTQIEYQKILDAEQSALNSISISLKSRLESWAHPGITAQILWKQDSDKSVRVEPPWACIKLGERGFEGDLARFGHGLQRSYMLALLQELTTLSDETAPTLIMGIEEPEIYQHPPQARHLAETLYELSESNTAQIMICSHNPLFIPGDNFEAIRIVREENEPSMSYVSQLLYSELSKELENSGQKALKEEGILAKLYPSLNPIVNEMFFCNTLILTEGIEDLAYISTYLILTENMNDFRKHGCHMVPMGGKSNIIKPLAMAKLLNIPTYVVCDADTNKENISDEEKRKSEVIKHKKDNRSILNILNYQKLNNWPSKSIHEINLTM
ncbi:MAG: AAA family ATPase, partial [Candidatus Omnitrophica bacterium]|nr:AAA family ATPase [Candidatus Omnitrophota bacterium]